MVDIDLDIEQLTVVQPRRRFDEVFQTVRDQGHGIEPLSAGRPFYAVDIALEFDEIGFSVACIAVHSVDQ